MKKCLNCRFTKADFEFTSISSVTCIQCRKERADKERRAMREAVLNLLGGVCTCCGEAEYVFLDIDHIHNDGAEERRRIKISTWRLALMEPARFQILCRNCNWAKFLGDCPHQKEN